MCILVYSSWDVFIFTNLPLSILLVGKNAVAALWHRVMVGAPGESDLLNIVSGWYPELDPLAGKLVGQSNIVL